MKTNPLRRSWTFSRAAALSLVWLMTSGIAAAENSVILNSGQSTWIGHTMVTCGAPPHIPEVVGVRFYCKDSPYETGLMVSASSNGSSEWGESSITGYQDATFCQSESRRLNWRYQGYLFPTDTHGSTVVKACNVSVNTVRLFESVLTFTPIPISPLLVSSMAIGHSSPFMPADGDLTDLQRVFENCQKTL